MICSLFFFSFLTFIVMYINNEFKVESRGIKKMVKETNLRQQIVEAGKRLQQRFFVASNDGNISCKIDDNTILITPTGVNKGEITPEQILKVDMEGNIIEGCMKITSEYKMHLAVYKIRDDVKAIVHAHPPAATAFAVTEVKLDDPVILPESIFSLGKIGYCKYGTPSTNEVSEAVEKEIKNSDALLLSNHGALTVGDNVMQAYYRMENLEMVSKITVYSKILGNLKALNNEEVEKLYKVKEEKGW